MPRLLALAFPLLVLHAATGAATGIPFVGQILHSSHEASVLVVPDGSGPPLTGAVEFGGAPIDVTIRVQLVDIDFAPVALFPPEDLWLRFNPEPGPVESCQLSPPNLPGGMFPADAPTDAGGWTEFALPLRGGGWSEGPCAVYLNGSPAQSPGGWVFDTIPLRTNSPDLDGDLVVDLTDIVLFARDFRGDYAYRSDYNWDGQVDLSDVVRFVPHIGRHCE